ncbi:MAG TPA: hypothetical protein DD435_14920 [Cyanobacteria bacterium UBA8530]|nr:hypothetical protein [Cyanobacteria bacterium UBA8530]
MLKRLEDLRQYEMAKGSPDLRGWDVYDRKGDYVGYVEDMLVDSNIEADNTLFVRYLSVRSEERCCLLPVGLIDLDEEHHQVTMREDARKLERFPEYKGEDLDETREQRFFATFITEESERHYQRPEFAREQRVRLLEEHLITGKCEDQVGEAVVRKRVDSHPVEKKVSLKREHLKIERRQINKPLSETEYKDMKAFDPTEEIRIPLMGEEAVVKREPFVKEEIIIRKVQDIEEKTISDTVRSESLEWIEHEKREEEQEGKIGPKRKNRSR